MAATLDSADNFLGFLRTALMTQLQERVASLGVCPRCHSKTLRASHQTLEIDFEQCEKCLTVYVLSVRP